MTCPPRPDDGDGNGELTSEALRNPLLGASSNGVLPNQSRPCIHIGTTSNELTNRREMQVMQVMQPSRLVSPGHSHSHRAQRALGRILCVHPSTRDATESTCSRPGNSRLRRAQRIRANSTRLHIKARCNGVDFQSSFTSSPCSRSN